MGQPKIIQLKTKHLFLMPLSSQDSEALHGPMSDPTTMRFWNEPPHASFDTTTQWIDRILANPHHCIWSLYLKSQDQVIGFIGFLRNQRVPNFIYLLRSEYQGKGLMSEAAHGALTYGFRHLEINRTEAWVQEGNEASQALLRKLGFSLVGRQIRQYTHSKDPVEIRIFGLRAGVYESSGQDSPRAPEFQTLEPVLLVNNVQETVDYYSRRLGFHVDFLWGNPPNLGAVSYGDWSPQTVRIQFRAAPPNMDSRIEGEIYILVEPEVETLYQRCQAQGVTICREITSQPWGMREFALQDINGYILRFGKVEKSDFL